MIDADFLRQTVNYSLQIIQVERLKVMIQVCVQPQILQFFSFRVSGLKASIVLT